MKTIEVHFTTGKTKFIECDSYQRLAPDGEPAYYVFKRGDEKFFSVDVSHVIYLIDTADKQVRDSPSEGH